MTPSTSSRALLLALALASPVALAADKSAAEAKALFTQAQSKYNKGEFNDALKLYSDAYDLKQSPNLLFNMAQCTRLLGDYDRAKFLYNRYLETSKSRPKNYDQVKRLITLTDAAIEDKKKQELMAAESAKAGAAAKAAEEKAKAAQEQQARAEAERAAAAKTEKAQRDADEKIKAAQLEAARAEAARAQAQRELALKDLDLAMMRADAAERQLVEAKKDNAAAAKQALTRAEAARAEANKAAENVKQREEDMKKAAATLVVVAPNGTDLKAPDAPVQEHTILAMNPDVSPANSLADGPPKAEEKKGVQPWWIIAGAGALVLIGGGTAAAVAASSGHQPPPPASLGSLGK